jgi:hypothetical protein
MLFSFQNPTRSFSELANSLLSINLAGMNDINRSMMVVRPKQPFLDWILSVDDEPGNLDLKYLRGECTAYLVPDYANDDEQPIIIEWCWDVVFEQELFSWFTDETLWPTDRTQVMFLEWFDIEFHSLVFDLVEDLPLEHIEDEPAADTSSSNGDPSSNGH